MESMTNLAELCDHLSDCLAQCLKQHCHPRLFPPCLGAFVDHLHANMMVNLPVLTLHTKAMRHGKSPFRQSAFFSALKANALK